MVGMQSTNHGEIVYDDRKWAEFLFKTGKEKARQTVQCIVVVSRRKDPLIDTYYRNYNTLLSNAISA
jgi:hypothetical protein